MKIDNGKANEKNERECGNNDIFHTICLGFHLKFLSIQEIDTQTLLVTKFIQKNCMHTIQFKKLIVIDL